MSSNKSNQLVSAIIDIAKYYNNVSQFARALSQYEATDSNQGNLSTDPIPAGSAQERATIADISEKKATLADIILHGNSGAPGTPDIYKPRQNNGKAVEVDKLLCLYAPDKPAASELLKGVVADEINNIKYVYKFIEGDPKKKIPDKFVKEESDNPLFVSGEYTASISLIKDANLDVKGRGTDALTVFLNAIPTLEFSRCVPYLDVRVITLPRSLKPAGNTAFDKKRSVNLVSFLEGNTGNGTTDFLQTALMDVAGVDILKELPEEIAALDDEELLEYTRRNAAGMELFTSPQTLVNADELYNPRNRDAEVLDPFRPLMTIEGFTTSIVPTVNVICYETAELKVKLHDRSRLNEVAALVRPDLFGYTTLMIEYGWSHPDGNSLERPGNSYGKFLDSLREKKHFRVTNSSYTFTPSGQVDITLKLVSKGAGAYFITRILNDSMGSSTKEIIKLIEAINYEFGELPDSTTKYKALKDLNPAMITDLIPDVQSALDISSESLDKLQKLATVLQKLPGGDDLGSTLDDLVGSAGVLKKLQTSATNAYDTKLLEIKHAKDPALLYFCDIDSSQRKNWPLVAALKSGTTSLRTAYGVRDQEYDNLNDLAFQKYQKLYYALTRDQKKAVKKLYKGSGKKKWVSLSRLFEVFVVKPIAALKQFEDVQVYFYNINSKCSWVSHMNIGEIPVNVANFEKRFKEYTNGTSKNITISEFINFINYMIFEDLSNPIYGFEKMYKSSQVSYDSESGSLKVKDQSRSNIYKLVGAAKKAATGKAQSDLATAYKDGTSNEIRIQAYLDNVLRDAYGYDDNEAAPNLEFVTPFLTVISETLPMTTLEPGKHVNGQNSKSVLRIHIADSSATMYKGHQDFLRSSIDNFVNQTLDKSLIDEEDSKVTITQVRNDLLAAKAGLGGVVAGDATIDVANGVYNAKVVKDLVKRMAPFVNYGSENTAILNCSVQTIQDPMLNVIHMNRPGGSANNNESLTLPSTFNPTKLSIEMLGCPVIKYLQEIFFDFFTMTTIDNFYAVNSINHTVSSTSFKTSAELYPSDGYASFRTLENRIQDVVQKVEDAKNKK